MQRVLACSVAVALLLGCGRLGFEAVDSETPVDASADDAATGDAATGDIWARPWSQPVLWEQSVAAYDTSPSLSADGRILYFVSSRFNGINGNNIFSSEFANGVWTEPKSMDELNDSGDVYQVELGPDALRVWFSRDNGTTGADVFTSSRSAVGDSWSPPVLVDDPSDLLGINTPANDMPPAVFADGLAAIFASDRSDSAGALDLYRASRASVSDPWTVAHLPELATTAIEDAPWVSQDGTRLFFMSNRLPNSVNGPEDSNIYYSARTDPTAFGPPVLVDAVNAADSAGVGSTWDEDFTVTDDGTFGVLCSNRDGSGRLFIVTR